MEIIAQIPLIGGFLATVIPFIVVLGIVVFIHEYGHYIVGRWCGIHAETFSLGFGPTLTGWTDSRGTRWQVAALPLGGYVQFLGDADGASRSDPDVLEAMDPATRARSFHGAAVWKRMLTVAAGPVANFLLSIVVYGALVTWQGVPVNEPVIGTVGDVPGFDRTIRPGDRLLSVEGRPVERFSDIYETAQDLGTARPLTVEVERDGDRLTLPMAYPLPPVVFSVEPLSPAQAAGLRKGDYIASADGKTLTAFRELQEAVQAAGGRQIPLEVVRDGERIDLTITPRERELLNPDGTVETRVMIGVGGDALVYPATYTPMPWTAAWMGVRQVGEVITMSLTGIGHIVSGTLGADNLQGPLGIAQVSGAQAAQGAVAFISLIALISTAIGLLNLFPIPVLDGGHLVIFAYEALTGRPPAERVLRIAMSIGLAMVLLLMVFATYNDVVRLATS